MDIIDRIDVDGEMFGKSGGSPTRINLMKTEFVTSISFGYHTDRRGIPKMNY